MKTPLSLCALAVLALAACAKNNASIEIAAVCAPPDDAQKCSFSSTCDAETIGRIRLDVAVTNYLWLFIQVNNQTPNNAKSDTGRVNTNDAWVHEYTVTFDGISLPDAQATILGSAYVPAAGSAVISVTPITEALGNTLAGQIPAGGARDVVGHLRLRGVYGDTTEFETGDFDIPIRLCSGCIGPGPGACATAGQFPFVCPHWGQTPASVKCAQP